MRSIARLVAAALLAFGGAAVEGQTQPGAAPDVLRVSRYADDTQAGSLRWAIETSNAAPGRYRIEIAPVGRPPYTITLAAPLPAIKGPLQIAGMAWAATGDYIAIDGAGYVSDKGVDTCPGAVPGQYGTNVRTTTNPGLRLVDTSSVEISGLEIRRFCIGILLNRASGSLIHDNRIVANRGGAGVMLTGDDGQGNATSTTTVHNTVQRNEFLDNGDGLELTRGAAFNLVADNVFLSTSANPEPSQGIEILRGNDNVVVRNRFEGYSDGVQINWGDRNYLGANVFTDNTFGLSLTGVDNVVDGNTIVGNAVGVAVRPASPSTIVRLTENAIFDNGQAITRCQAGGSCDPALRKGAIVFGLPGGEHAEFVGSRGGGVTPNPATLLHICPDHAPDCQSAPNHGIRPPELTRVNAAQQGSAVTGRVRAEPRRRYVVELFANPSASGREAERFVGRVTVNTGADGVAMFTIPADGERQRPAAGSYTATVTSADGATSELSAPIRARP
jgi:3-dehydroshikimate dehydratase